MNKYKRDSAKEVEYTDIPDVEAIKTRKTFVLKNNLNYRWNKDSFIK